MSSTEYKEDLIAWFADGTSQKDRILAALQPGYVNVDERSQMDLLLFTLKYARLLTYYNKENQVTSRTPDWEKFFTHAVVVALARIALENLDISQNLFNKQLHEVLTTSNSQNRQESFQRLFYVMRYFVGVMNEWNSSLKFDKTFEQLQVQISLIISSTLSRSVCRLDAVAKQAHDAVDQDVQFDTTNFGAIWEYDGDCTDGENFFSGTTDREKYQSACQVVQAAYQRFYEEAATIQAHAQTYLDKLPELGQNLTPHIALLVAFFELFKTAQDSVNTITIRHLEFYYRQVLLLKNNPMRPDRVLVSFTLAEGYDSQEVEQNALLLGGSDANGKALYYRMINALTVYPVSLEQVYTLYVAANPVIYTAAGDPTQYVTNIYSALDVNQTNVADPGQRPRWPMFGQDQVENATWARNMDDARLGFAVVSPNLFLQEGERTVRLEFRFRSRLQTETGEEALPSDVGFEDFLDQLQVMADNEGVTRDNVFLEVFLSAFNLSLTTEKGWMDIDFYMPTLVENGFDLEFSLTLDDAAITPYQEEIHALGLQVDQPVVQALLNPMGRTYVYSLLQGQRLTDLATVVSVIGVKNLVIYNEKSALSADAPFAPFGPAPTVGSAFRIGYPEAFEKELSDLSVYLEWTGLPDYTNGFADYFSAYPDTVSNSDYRVTVSRLTSQQWHPGPGLREEFALFAEQEDDEGNPTHILDDETVFSPIDTQKISASATYDFTPQPELTSTTRSGFIQFELISPSFGFGASEYTKVLSDVTLANATTIVKNKGDDGVELLPIPNDPFTPMAKAVSMDYEAQSSLFPVEGGSDGQIRNADRFFMLQPFGISEQEVKSSQSEVPIVPDYEVAGNLILGLKGIQAPQALSIYLQIAEGSVEDSLTLNQTVSWSYLSSSGWNPFKASDILTDTTRDAIQSGVVVLNLPKYITDQNPMMPVGYFWLKASLPSESPLRRNAFGVSLNGALLEWVDKGNDPSHLSTALPAGSVTAMADQPASIKAVSQPFPSFGGRLAEDNSAFRVRVSERLRHKGRAIMPKDYELITLSNFAEVQKAKCFSGRSVDNRREAGGVLLAILPDVNDSKIYNKYRPKLSRSRLEAIQQLLASKAGPFCNIDVINPLYERIRVICTVRFTAGGDPGSLTAQLNEDLKNWLTPWLNAQSTREEFGGSLYKSDIVGYVERLDYIDFVTGFSVVKTVDLDVAGYTPEDKRDGMGDGNYNLYDTASPANADDSEEISPFRPWSILVSASEHEITVTTDSQYIEPEKRGIGNMQLTSDFILVKEGSEEYNDGSSNPSTA